MGEYADMEIDRAMFGGGAWGMPLRPRTVARPACSECGKANLRFGDVKGGGTQLVDPHTSLPHKCLIPGKLPKPSIL